MATLWPAPSNQLFPHHLPLVHSVWTHTEEREGREGGRKGGREGEGGGRGEERGREGGRGREEEKDARAHTFQSV